MIGDLVVIETQGTRNVSGGVFRIGVPALRRKVEGRIDDTKVGASQFLRQPVRCDDETAGLAHEIPPAGTLGLGGGFTEPDTKAPVLLALLLDPGDVDRSDLAGPGHMCAAAGLAVNAGVVANAHEADAAEPNRRPH